MLRRLLWLACAIFFLASAFVLLGQPSGADGQTPVTGALNTAEKLDAAVASGVISREVADVYLVWAVTGNPLLPSEFFSDARWNATRDLLALDARNQSRRSLQRGSTPNIVESTLGGICYNNGQSLPNITNSNHFHIEYDTIGGGLAITDYVAALELTWQREIGDFGFALPPVLQSNPPPGNRYHVRINNMGMSGLYGYVWYAGAHAGCADGSSPCTADNPNTAWIENGSYATCMVLNSNFSTLSPNARNALSSTVAHEFFHAVQLGEAAYVGHYNVNNKRDRTLVESFTTAIEDEVFDAANDNARSFNYPDFSQCLGSNNQPGSSGVYSNWWLVRAMIEPFGTQKPGGSEQILQDFFEVTSRNPSITHLNALTKAFGDNGGALGDAYHNAAIALHTMKPCTDGYVYPYCLKKAAIYTNARGIPALHGAISGVGNTYFGAVQDHYALNWIGLPTGVPTYTLVFSNTDSAGDFRVSAVCDTGTQLRVSTVATRATAGQAFSETVDVSACASMFATITNLNQTASAPNTCIAQSYALAVVLDAVPPTPTPTPTQTSTSTPLPTATVTATPVPTVTQIPTAVKLANLDAIWVGQHAKIRWTSLNKFDAQYFMVYRSLLKEVGRLPAEATPIEDAKKIPPTGATNFSMTDANSSPVTRYFYYLVETDLQGHETVYGPVMPPQLVRLMFPIIMR